jgi:hypothetical protein
MKRPRNYVWYFLVLAVLGSVALVAPILFNLSQLLTVEKIAEAEARWEQNGPASYDLKLEDRRSPDAHLEVYDVKVRERKVVELRVNDHEETLTALSPEQRRQWTVPGLFEQMRAHLAEEEQGKRRNFATANFHPHLGYPVRYVRRVRGTKERLEWRITVTPLSP